jgi:deoxyribose-phosphate aldolase
MDVSQQPAGPTAPATVEELAAILDYPIEAAVLTSDEISASVRLAASLGLASVSVPSCEADLAVRLLEGTATASASLVGYPIGSGSTAAKLYEARDLLRRGVKEIEFVLNLGKLASRQFQYVESELLQISASCHENGAILKLVFESSRLAEDLKVIACKIAKRVEADIVVSEAFPVSGASSDADLALLKKVSKEVCGLSGCADGLDQALSRHSLGCARIRCAAPRELLAAWKERLDTIAASSGVPPA